MTDAKTYDPTSSNSGDQSRCTRRQRSRDLAAQSDGSNWHYQIPIRDLSAYKTGTFLGPTLPKGGRCPPICITVTSFMPRFVQRQTGPRVKRKAQPQQACTAIRRGCVARLFVECFFPSISIRPMAGIARFLG